MVKRTLICACFLLATAFAAAESVMVTTVKPWESSQNVRIAVVLNNKPVPGARVDFADLLFPRSASPCSRATMAWLLRSCCRRGITK